MSTSEHRLPALTRRARALPIWRRVLRSAAALGIAASPAACILRSAPVQTRSFVIAAQNDANDNAPTKVDAVMIYDRAMLPKVLAMSARQWFDSTEQLRNDFPRGFELREWEVVPGAKVDVSRLPFRGGGLGLVVFANYRGTGDHRARLDTWRRPQIVLRDRTFSVVDRP